MEDKMELGELDQFPADIIRIGENSLGVLFPKRNIEFSGLKKGDKIKVYYKVVEKEGEPDAPSEPEEEAEE